MINEVTKEAEETVNPEDSAKEEKHEEATAAKSAETTTTTTAAATAGDTGEEKQELSSSSGEDVQQQSVPEESTTSVAGEPAATDSPTEAAAEKPDTPATEEPAQDVDFGAILEEFEQDQEEYHPGKLVEGKIVGISEREVLINFGYKSEGMVPTDEFLSPEGELNIEVGDEVEVVIKTIYSGDSPPVLSRHDAIHRKSWDAIEKAYNEESNVTGRVVSKTKGGLKVDLDGVEAFLPGSQVDSRPVRNLDTFIGQEIEARVIKFSRKRNNIVVSRKVLTDEVIEKLKKETLSKIEEQYVVEGVIKNLTEYGAFVDLGGIDGLLHVTDMSWGRLHNPNELFKVNDKVQVKVLKLDREKEKVSLGYKQLQPDPWSTVVEVYPVDSVIEGRVSSVTDYGAFVELEPGVEGLVHISEMSWSKRMKNPKKILKANDQVKVQVLGIDTEERRISLGMKQLQENPWDTIADRYEIGSKIKGKVRNLTDFGAFVEVEEGVDGLVHVSDISHSKKIKHPRDVLKKDQEVEAVVTNIDTEGHRLSLSIKDLTPSAWDTFVEKHNPGDVVKGKVSRFAGFGVFVELSEDLEGLCHISELSDERVEKPEDVVSIGQELDFKILRIEHDVQKIGLSHRAVGKDDEPIIDSRQYSTEAKGGMASLGELANLKLGGQPEDGEEQEEEKPKLSKKERRALKAKKKAEAEARGETVEAAETEAQPETAETESADSDESPETAVDSGQEQQQTAEATTATDEAASADQSETVEAADAPVEKADEQTIASAPDEESATTAETADQPTGEATSETGSASPEAVGDAEATATAEDAASAEQKPDEQPTEAKTGRPEDESDPTPESSAEEAAPDEAADAADQPKAANETAADGEEELEEKSAKK